MTQPLTPPPLNGLSITGGTFYAAPITKRVKRRIRINVKNYTDLEIREAAKKGWRGGVGKGRAIKEKRFKKTI